MYQKCQISKNINKWGIYCVTISHINLIHIIIHSPQERKLVFFPPWTPSSSQRKRQSRSTLSTAHISIARPSTSAQWIRSGCDVSFFSGVNGQWELACRANTELCVPIHSVLNRPAELERAHRRLRPDDAFCTRAQIPRNKK